jgi:hypothetical protein
MKRPMKCGFCLDGNHAHCPGGVRNGDGQIVLCACTCELAGQPRCTDCWHRNPEDIGPDWTCLEKDGCTARLAKRQASNPTLQMMRKIKAETAARQAAERRERLGVELDRAGIPRPRVGECRCCGKPTKGGNFLPGHDSRFLSRLVAEPGDSSRNIAYSISPAFGNKYDKRVTA